MSKAEPPPKVLLVTSALPQEGKTTISFNAAVTFAQRGSKVLLIDADLRHPTFSAKSFAVAGSRTQESNPAASFGLSDLLEGDHGLLDNELQPELIQHPGAPNLAILQAGKRPLYPAELLGSERMRLLIAKLREEFDFILIDSPPVLSVTDPVVLSDYADAVLLVVRSERTTLEALLRTRELLARAGARLAGALVNRINLRSPDYYFYYGHYTSKQVKDYLHESN